MFSFKNKFDLLIIILSFKKQGTCPLKDASVDAVRRFGAYRLLREQTCFAPTVASTTLAKPKPCFLKLKIMINKLNLFLKLNIHKNVIQILFNSDKIVRIDIFINKPNSDI